MTRPLPIAKVSFRLFLPLALAGAASAQAGRSDTIRLKDGKDQQVRIDAEEYGGVTFTPPRGAASTVPWSDVVSISYGGAAEFTQARSDVSAGKLDAAKAALEEMKQDKQLRPVLRQQVLFYLAGIHQREGRWDDAIVAYGELLKEFPKTRFLLKVGEGLLACHIAKGDAAGGTKALDQFTADVRAANVGPEVEVELNLLRGRLLESQAKWAEAAAIYGVAEKQSGVTPAASHRAKLGLARCLLRQTPPRTADANQQLQALKDAADADASVLAGAWNGIGDILLAEGRTKSQIDTLLEALFAYLRAVVQYGPTPGESTEEYEHGLWGAAECFKSIAELEKDATKKKLYSERKQERLDQLKKEFPNSIFLKR